MKLASSKKFMITAIAALLFVGAIYTACSFTHALDPITDPGKYAKALKRVRDFPKVEECFPKEIPADAVNVSLFQCNGIGQGGTELTLTFTANDEIFKEYKKKASENAVWVGKRSDPAAEEQGIIMRSFVLSDNDLLDISDDYDIYLIYSKAAGTNDFMWNHGTLTMITINEETKELIFCTKKY